jgi:hypothetical protein
VARVLRDDVRRYPVSSHYGTDLPTVRGGIKSPIDTNVTQINSSQCRYTYNPVYKWDYTYRTRARSFLHSFDQRGCRWSSSESLVKEYFSDIESEAYRFCLALQAYEDSDFKVMDPRDIFLGQFDLGPEFALKLKRMRTKAFLKAVNGRFMIPPDWYDEVPDTESIVDIGAIFNYKKCIRWEEPASTDINFMFLDVEPPDQDTIDSFEETCDEILAEIPIEAVAEVPSEEATTSLSNSQTAEGIPLRLEKVFTNRGCKISSTLYGAKHTSLYKGPCEVRDILLLPPDVSNTVKWIDYQTLEVIRHHKLSRHTKDEWTYRNRYKRLTNKNISAWLCRDIEKEGLTKPRWLLGVMLRCLDSRFKFPAFKIHDFYERVEIGDLQTKRGHGLGMANSLTTLMNMTLFRMAAYEYNKMYEGELDGLFLNDDSVVGFVGVEHSTEYFKEMDWDICEQCRVLTKDTKSFVATHGFVLCEDYYSIFKPDISRKDSTWRYECLLPLHAVNIAHAKSIANALQVEGHYYDQYKTLWVQKWGYEFFKDEYFHPYIFGGWSSSIINGLSFDFRTEERVGLNALSIKACLAIAHKNSLEVPKNIYKKLYKKWVKKIEDQDCLVQFQSLPSQLGITIEDKGIEALGWDSNLQMAVGHCFRWETFPDLVNRCWEKLYKKRLEYYKKIYIWSFNIDSKLVFPALRALFKHTDFLPPSSLKIGEVPIKVLEDTTDQCIYRPLFPKHCAIATAIGYPFKLSYPNPFYVMGADYFMTSDELRKAAIHENRTYMVGYDHPHQPCFFSSLEDGYTVFHNYFYNPYLARELLLSDVDENEDYAPIYYGWEYKDIKEKYTLFKREISFLEERNLTNLDLNFENTYQLISISDDVDYEDLEDLDCYDILRPEEEGLDEGILDHKPAEEAEGDDFFDRQLKLGYESIMQTFTWRGPIFNAVPEEGNSGTTYMMWGFQQNMLQIPHFRKSLLDMVSTEAWNGFIGTLGEKFSNYLIEESSESDLEGGFFGEDF